MSKKFAKPKGLPTRAFEVWESVFKKNKGKGDERAAKIAWSAVKKGWKKVKDKWVRKEVSEMKMPETFKGSVTDLTDLNIDISNTKISSIEIMRIGKWDHPLYGEFEITDDRLERFKENFDKEVRKAVAVDVEHKSDDGAVGWFKEVRIMENSLVADIEWTNEGIRLIKDKKYRFFSPEFADVYEDAATGQEFMDVLLGGAITNRPFFQELEEITLSDKIKGKKMSNKKKSSKKTNKKVDDEVNKKLDDKKKKGEADNKDLDKKLKKPLKNKKKKKGGVKNKMSKKKQTKKVNKITKKASVKTPSKKMAGRTVNVSKKKFAELERQAALGLKAHRELRSKKFSEEIQGITFSESNVKGVILPKSTKKAHALMVMLTKVQRKKFRAFLKTLPSLKLFGEVGKDIISKDEPSDDPQIELDRRANKLMSEHKGKKPLTYSEALHKADAQMKKEGIKTDKHGAKTI